MTSHPFFFSSQGRALYAQHSHLERESRWPVIPLFYIEKHNPRETNLVTLVLNHKYLLLEKKQPLSKRMGGCYLIIMEL